MVSIIRYKEIFQFGGNPKVEYIERVFERTSNLKLMEQQSTNDARENGTMLE